MKKELWIASVMVSVLVLAAGAPAWAGLLGDDQASPSDVPAPSCCAEPVKPCCPPPACCCAKPGKCCCPLVEVPLELCHPCTGCKIVIPVCVPKCVAKCPPEVHCRKALIGVQVTRYRWPGGPVVKVRFFAHGGYKVHVH